MTKLRLDIYPPTGHHMRDLCIETFTAAWPPRFLMAAHPGLSTLFGLSWRPMNSLFLDLYTNISRNNASLINAKVYNQLIDVFFGSSIWKLGNAITILTESYD